MKGILFEFLNRLYVKLEKSSFEKLQPGSWGTSGKFGVNRTTNPIINEDLDFSKLYFGVINRYEASIEGMARTVNK